jgi:hypothetical protein
MLYALKESFEQLEIDYVPKNLTDGLLKYYSLLKEHNDVISSTFY